MQPTRMEVNAAIEGLIKNETDAWAELASTVIRFGHSLPIQSVFSFEYRKHTTREDGEMAGFTKEHGNVTIKSKTEETVEKSVGIHKERVGYYKLYKRSKTAIVFHHFWKSDVGTITDFEDEPEFHTIIYDPKNLKPVSFGVDFDKPVVTLGNLEIKRSYFRVLRGKDAGEDIRGWFFVSIIG